MRVLQLLFLLTCCHAYVCAQQTVYGNNPQAGKYVSTVDAKIYYEVYGQGKPLVLLHGGFFGYIDEYGPYIPEWSKHYKVIAIATRGHGKSEIGTKQYSQLLLAEDVVAILDKESNDSAVVVGFSAGAATALYLAAHYPRKVSKVVALAGKIQSKYSQPGKREEMKTWTYNAMKSRYQDFFTQREKLMPQPERAGEWLERLKPLWLAEELMPQEKAKQISCPVLVVGGDRDEYTTVEGFVADYRTIPNAQLAILPGCNHTDMIFKLSVMYDTVFPFLKK